MSLCGRGRRGGRGPSFPHLFSGPFTPCPLSLANVHPAPRVVLGEQQSSWAGWLVRSDWVWTLAWMTGGMPGPGNGARLNYFSGYCGPQYTFLSPCPSWKFHCAEDLCVSARVWYEEHVGRGWKDPGFVAFLALRSQPAAPALKSLAFQETCRESRKEALSTLQATLAGQCQLDITWKNYDSTP